MSLLWTEDLAVGFGLIDTQHQELFNRYPDEFMVRQEDQCLTGRAGAGRGTRMDIHPFMRSDYLAPAEFEATINQSGVYYNRVNIQPRDT